MFWMGLHSSWGQRSRRCTCWEFADADLSGPGWIMIALTFCWVAHDGGWPIPLSGPEIHQVVAELSQDWGPPLGDAWTAVVRDRSSSVGYTRH